MNCLLFHLLCYQDFYIKMHNLEVIGDFLSYFDPLIWTLCLNSRGGL